MDTILSLHNVSKVYGANIVVNNASFDIKRGSVCGLLGPNGAGKTTTMKIIMNEVKCDNGFVRYDENLKIKYLRDVPEFYEFYSVYEYLYFILEIAHYSKDKDIRINEVLKMFNIDNFKDYRLKKLSRGLRQKVGLASVIIDEPDVLILDEPISALDPLGRKEILDIIAILKGKVTIIFSSHILSDIEKICDHIILINKGKIILNDSVSNIFMQKKNLLVTFNNREELLKIREKLKYNSLFSINVANCLEIECEDVEVAQKEIFSLLLENDVNVKSICVKNESLEEIFLREVKNNG